MRQSIWRGGKRFFRSEQGVTAMEYALLAALIAVVIIVSVAGTGDSVKAFYTYVADKVTVAVGS